MSNGTLLDAKLMDNQHQMTSQNGSGKYYTYSQPTLTSQPGPQSVPFQKQRFNPYSNRLNSSTSYFQKNYTQLSAPAKPASALPTSYSYQVKYGGSSNTTTVATATTPATSNNVSVVNDTKDSVVLQISNLDSTVEETALRNFLISQLKPITPIISLNFENPSLAKVKVPSQQYAKQVVAHLHRKKIGHKRMIVSYIRDPSSAESSALRCQVAGLLKDVPNYSLPVYKFRELFQSRFKASISVMDLYRMQDICSIAVDKNDEKIISLQPDLVMTMKTNPLVESSQHSVPYCIYHFKREQDKGWAEQEIEQLPCVAMSIGQIQSIIYGLLKTHKDDIPIASLVYCIENELNIKIVASESGVNLEHLVCCVRGVQITNNSFGIKVVTWMEHDSATNNGKEVQDDGIFSKHYKSGTMGGDSLTQISREVIELIKMCPKSTMKFNRFIPAYHNHFGKQCRVADYGYTRLIELFEALSNVVQVMGDGENRQITLTHKIQVRRFVTDLLKILRCQANKSILLSQLPTIFSQYMNRPFEITEYGVCNINDILDGLVHNNSIVVSTVHNGAEVLLSMIKRKQTPSELEKTCIFAGEVVELFRNAPQFAINFKKFVRSYHYHFGYQCRLSDYGFLKLADLLDAISGVVEMEANNGSDEDRKILLSQKIALRVFSEQLQEMIVYCTGGSQSMVKVNDVLRYHKSKFGYQIQAQSFGYYNMVDVIRASPYTELIETDGNYWVVSHLDDPIFRAKAYAVCYCFHESNTKSMPLPKFLQLFMQKFNETINEKMLYDMKHAVQIFNINNMSMIALTPIMKFILDIVQMLQTTSPLNLIDLKTMMNMSITTCFEFGYPNISSLINAFGDLFLSSNATNVHERSEIELNPECIFSKKTNSVFEPPQSISTLPAPEPYMPTTIPQLPQPQPRAPIQQQQQQQQQLQRQQSISQDSNFKSMVCGGQQSCMNQCHNPSIMPRLPMANICNNNNSRIPYEMCNMGGVNNMAACYNYQYGCNSNTCANIAMQNMCSGAPTGMAGCNLPFGDVSQGAMMGNNKENTYCDFPARSNNINGYNPNSMMNLNSANNINLNTNSNYSILKTNNNCCNNLNNNNNSNNNNNNIGISNVMKQTTNDTLKTESKLYERRNVSGLQQLNYCGFLNNNSNNGGGGGGSATTGYANLNSSGYGKLDPMSMNLNYLLDDDLRASLLGFYEPPKPDTPPSRIIPFWVDPIWNSSGGAGCGDATQSVETLNIHLPELKTLSILPVILSPCQISLSVKKNGTFSFDASDINGNMSGGK